jgi:hypothetical protein
MAVQDRDKVRLRLRLLDGCLQALEDANERDERTVPAPVAERVRAIVPAVVPGMPISEAINLVLHDQERYVGETGGLLVMPEDDCEEPLDGAGARELTERIRSATRQVCMLLYEAHRRRAWQVLGYTTWDQYVRTELALSRTRSYELVDQGRTMFALRAAAGISAFPEISAYAAEQIKPYMPEVIEAVRSRTAGLPEPEALAIVIQVVGEHRALVARDRPHRAEREARAAGRPEILGLREAIERLASMPPPVDLLATLDREEVERLAGIERALTWLAGFADECRKRQPDAVRNSEHADGVRAAPPPDGPAAR